MNKEVLTRAVAFIEPWLRYRHERLEIPGFVVAIASEGEVVFEKAYGFADVEGKEELTTSHKFRIASHSKTFTATAVMQLAEQGKLHIDEPVAKHVKWLASHRDERIAQITARQLMSHGSGMIRDGLECNYWQMLKPFPDAAELEQKILDAELIYGNNEQMKYSNIGSSLLGVLIETVSGMSYSDYVHKHILEPLRLRNTGPEFVREILSDVVTGYARPVLEKTRLPIARDIDTRAMAPATGFYSTIGDMLIYFNAQRVGSGKLLSDQSKREMQKTQWRIPNSNVNEEYGLGFAIDYCGERKLLGHGGAFPGQRTRTLFDTKDDLLVIVLTNCIDADPKEMGKAIFSVVDHFKSSSEDSDASTIDELRRFQGTFMQLWCDTSIVENGKRLIAVNPSCWFPFDSAQGGEELERVDSGTLRVVKANGYCAAGELITYKFDETGHPLEINYTGADMWREEEYKARLRKERNELAPAPVSG